MRVSDYILLPRSERIKHIDLTSPCELIKMGGNWTNRKSDFLCFHELDNDIELWRGRVLRCHLCENDTQSEYVCINPKHVYLGTPRENLRDRPLELAQRGGKALKGIKRSDEFCAKNRKRLCVPISATNTDTGMTYYFESSKQAAETLGVLRSGISMVLSGKYQQHNGYTFSRLN